MLTKNFRWVVPGKRLMETEPLCHLRQDPPVRARLAHRRHKGALTRNATFGIGHGAIFLAPCRRGQADMRQLSGIRLRSDIRDDHQRATGKRVAHAAGLRQRYRRIGAHDPDCFHLAAGYRIKQRHRREARLLGDPFTAPEALQARHVLCAEIHVRRQLSRQPADFTPAHGVWLAGE